MRIRTIYERPRINRLFDDVVSCPLTIVVAGAGFGKTTAAREWIRKSEVPALWVGLTGDDTYAAWDKICDGIEQIDSSISDELRTDGAPTSTWDISRIIRLLRRRFSESVVVCIDDVHLLADDDPILKLIDTMAFEQIENLHILLLTRREPHLSIGTLTSKGLCTTIDEKTLCFDNGETAGYLSMRGLRLTKKAVDRVYSMSEGWVSAIYLISEGIRSGGSIAERKNIERLFSENLMAQLSTSEQEMLCRLATIEPMTASCAICAVGDNNAESLLDRLVAENAFVSLDAEGIYRFHPLLNEYLVKLCPDDETQRNVYHRAGNWYLEQPRSYSTFSVDLFVKSGFLEEFLEALDHPYAWRLLFFDMDAICALAEQLPDEECTLHPFPYLQIVFFLLLSGDTRKVRMGKRFFQTMQDYFSTHEHAYRELILGELIVISRVMGFGDIPKGTEPLEEAARLFGGRPSGILRACDPFTFGLPMLLESEWMGEGQLDAAVQRCQYNPYELVTDGFGRGSEQLVLAESSLMRAQMDKARISAEQAYEEALTAEQWFIVVSACFTLMRRALFLGDSESAVTHLATMRSVVPEAEHQIDQNRISIPMLREVISLSECFLNTTFMRWDDVPGDFIDGTHVHSIVGMGISEVFAARALLMMGNTSGAERMCRRHENLPNVCQEAKLSRLIIESLARERLYGKGAGISMMEDALKQAYSDGAILPFVEIPGALNLLKTTGAWKQADVDFCKKISTACEEYERAAPTKSAGLFIKLTDRELQILRLAARGMTRSQIAESTCVKEDTVKKHLASIYRKLDASNRTEALRTARIEGLL